MDARNPAAMTLTLPSDREIVLTRAFDAPRRLVFEAWTRPEHVKHWWGCHRSMLLVCEIDLRPGGAYRFVLRAPDGNDYTFKGVYREIVPPARLIYTQVLDVETYADRPAIVTVTFDEKDGRTTLTSRSLYKSAEDRDAHLQSGMEAGAAETFDRLADHLRTMA